MIIPGARVLLITLLTIAFLFFLVGCDEITDELEKELRREAQRVVDEIGEEAKEKLKKEIKDQIDQMPIILPVVPVIDKPAAPILISPSHNANLDGSNLSFRWEKTSHTTSYLLSVRRVSDNATIVGKNLVGTSFSMRFPNDGHAYRWRVTAYGPGGWGPSSEWQAFTCGSAKTESPSAPVLSTPAANANVPSDTVNFEWSGIPAATGYGITIQRLSDYKVIANVPVKATSYKQGGFPNDGTQYRWRVAAYNQGGWGPASGWRIFTNGTLSPPQKPVLVTPKDKDIISGTSATFSWQEIEQAKGYWLIIERLSDGAKVISKEVKINSYTLNGLPNDGSQFRWQVFAHGSGGWSPASGWRAFTSGTTIKPAPPQLRDPRNNADLSESTITFSWNEVKGADRYYLRVLNTATKKFIIDENVGKVYQKTVSGFSADGSKYQWQVVAGNSSGRGDPSEIRSFSTSVPDMSNIYDQAIEWADPDKVPRKNPDYFWDCHRFVMDAYKFGSKIDKKILDNYGGSAHVVYKKYKNIVDSNKTKENEPPRGSMVLYSLYDNSTPHTALSLGKGEIIHNNSSCDKWENNKCVKGQISEVKVEKFDESYLINGYLGWLWPK